MTGKSKALITELSADVEQAVHKIARVQMDATLNPATVVLVSAVQKSLIVALNLLQLVAEGE